MSDLHALLINSKSTYLCSVHFIQHHNGRTVVIKHQPPEICYSVGQRMLGNYKGSRLLVALTKGGEKGLMSGGGKISHHFFQRNIKPRSLKAGKKTHLAGLYKSYLILLIITVP